MTHKTRSLDVVLAKRKERFIIFGTLILQLASVLDASAVQLYISEAAHFNTPDALSTVKVTPARCDERDTIEIPLDKLHDPSKARGNPRYQLTLTDCYKFTVSYKTRNVSLEYYRLKNISAFCDLSHFTFNFGGVADLYKLNSLKRGPSDASRRCNFVRRGRVYPHEDEAIQDKKNNPMFVIVYVLVGIFVIALLWTICFLVGYRMFKKHSTTLIRSPSDFGLTRLSDQSEEERTGFPPSAPEVAARGASGINNDGGIIQTETGGASRLPESELSVVELHHQADNHRNGQRDLKASKNYSRFDTGPPNYQDLYKN